MVEELSHGIVEVYIRMRCVYPRDSTDLMPKRFRAEDRSVCWTDFCWNGCPTLWIFSSVEQCIM